MAEVSVPDGVKMWKIGKDSANVGSWNNYQDNQGYSLFCTANSRYLTWKKVPVGINLDFIDDPSVGKTHFRLPDGSERDLLSGELVAFGIGGGEAFLRYAHRTVGINLEWSAAPVFEWRIFGGPVGTPIQENTPVAILNEKVEPNPDFLIYFNRVQGGGSDIGWTSSPGFWDQVRFLSEKGLTEAARLAVKSVLPV